MRELSMCADLGDEIEALTLSKKGDSSM